MIESLVRVGTIYIPVKDINQSTDWYTNNLGAELSYKDGDKSILNLAHQSFFLVKSPENESLNFLDHHGKECFALTFEVNGQKALNLIHAELQKRGVEVSQIENRGHAGFNFVFKDLNGNKFDVWSELSPIFKEKYNICS